MFWVNLLIAQCKLNDIARSPDFFHFFIAFRNDVMRSFLRFVIGLREVLPHDADAEQLYRADKDDHTHGRCPAGDRIAEAQASDNDDDQHDRCHECHPYPRPGCDIERHLREIDDAVKCILQQLPEVPLRLTGHTLDILIWQPVRFKPDPAEDALRKAVILTHRNDRIHHLPLHEAEVPRTVHDVGI